MSHTMIIKIGGGRELLTANKALMGLFTAVDPFMRV